MATLDIPVFNSPVQTYKFSYKARLFLAQSFNKHLFLVFYPILDTRIYVCLSVCVSRSGYPSWILKRDGLESSVQRLISSIGKTKKIKQKSWQRFFLDIFHIFENNLVFILLTFWTNSIFFYFFVLYFFYEIFFFFR